MNFKRIALAVVLFATTSIVWAQDRNDDSLSFDLENASFINAVKEIESKAGCFFYYRKKDVDSVSVTLHVKGASLVAVLDQIIRNTALHYAIDPNRNIFITRSIIIDTSLAD